MTRSCWHTQVSLPSLRDCNKLRDIESRERKWPSFSLPLRFFSRTHLGRRLLVYSVTDGCSICSESFCWTHPDKSKWRPEKWHNDTAAELGPTGQSINHDHQGIQSFVTMTITVYLRTIIMVYIYVLFLRIGTLTTEATMFIAHMGLVWLRLVSGW